MIAPMAGAVGGQMKSSIVGRLQIKGADSPVGIADDAIAHPVGHPATRSDDDAARHDRAWHGAHRQMLETAALNRSPTNGSGIERAKERHEVPTADRSA